MHTDDPSADPLSPSALLEVIAENEKKIASLQAENAYLRQNSILVDDNDTDVLTLKEILTLMPGNIFWKNREGICLGCNNNLAHFLGYESADQVVGKTSRDFSPPEFAAKIDAIDQEIMESKTGRFLEETTLDKNGQVAVFFTHKIPLFNRSGEAIGLLGISLNITQQKKMEEDLKIAKEKAEASNQAKSQFLAVVNHELRTPLSSIIGLLRFLKQDKLSLAEKKKIIEAAENCAQHLLSLVSDVLDFTQLETSRYKLRITSIHLENMLYEIHSMLKTLAENKNLTLNIDLNPTVPKEINSDLRILNQILINLVSNAIKFTETGHVTIQVQNLYQHHSKVQLAFSVIDTGLGIPNDKLDLIFKPFQQLEDAYTRQSSRSGTGLGLTIVKKLAELINAKIQVVSTPGKGSVFSFYAEFEIPHPATSVKALTTSKKKKTTSSSGVIYPDMISFKPKILLVEDDPIIQFIHEKMLLDLGCDVEIVSYGREAIEKIKNHHLMLVDISLPDITGFEVIKTIRQHAYSKSTPIIALTVYTGKTEKEACLAAGANEFMNKPISRSRLKKLLLRYLTAHPA